MVKSFGMETPDEELVIQVQKGESSLFNILVERYQRRIYGVVLGMVHHREEALDLAQEVFLKAYKALPQFKGHSRFYTWLYRIAINTVIDFRRKSKGVTSFSIDDENIKEIPGNTASPDRQAINQELREELHSALVSLPEDQRAVIVLRELEELSYQEIADTLECTIGTVMSRLHYARKRLRERLKSYL